MQSFSQRFVIWKWFKGTEWLAPSLPLYQNCHCWNPSTPRIITPIVQLSKRGFVSINQSLQGCQIKYRLGASQRIGELCKYIFPVISPLLGRVARRRHFHNSVRDWMENIFYLNGNVENVAFQPNVFDCKRLQRVRDLQKMSLPLLVFSQKSAFIFFADLL